MIQTTKFKFQSKITHQENTTEMKIAGDSQEFAVSMAALVKNPLLFRDALLGMREIITSDFRPDIDPIKREQYFTWLRGELQRMAMEHIDEQERLKSKLQGDVRERNKVQRRLKVLRSQETKIQEQIDELNREKLEKPLKEINRAVQQFAQNRRIRAEIRQGQLQFRLFDPVITVHPDAVVFEGFSLDSSSYVNLKINHSNFDQQQEPSYGTTNIDFSNEFAYQLGKIRSFNDFLLMVNPEGVEVASNEDSYFEKKIELPPSWVKGFLQVSSSAILEGVEIDLQQIDLFNLISFLKKHPTKHSPKGMIFHLVPGKRVKVELEPFEDILQLSCTYHGKARAIRVWGRDRLKLLEPIISYSDGVKLKLLGTGLPFYFSISMPDMIYQVGFSGWTDNSWSTSTLFGAMFTTTEEKLDDEVRDYLRNELTCKVEELYNRFDRDSVNATLKELFVKGRAVYELDTELIRYRILSQTGFPESVTAPSREEREGEKLVKSTEIIKQTDTEFKGEVANYKMELVFTENGTIEKATCTCSIGKNDMHRTGLCAHLIALNLNLIKEGLR